MGIYSIENTYCATVYVQANTLRDANAKLEALLGKTINACDKAWFSEAQFGTPEMPELSFATAFTSYGPKDDAVLNSVTNTEFGKKMEAESRGGKSRLLPNIDRSNFSGKGMCVYWCDVELASTVFFRAKDDIEATEKRVDLEDWDVDLEYTRTWLYPEALDDRDFPYALSPNFAIRARKGCELGLRWPEKEHVEAASPLAKAVSSVAVPTDDPPRHTSSADGAVQYLAERLRKYSTHCGGHFASMIVEHARMLVLRWWKHSV
ncbi:hypothetical protein LAC81_27080 [Ensifer adhaerens]|uniref:hypothetical protein n=1 Tax=Ensifer adhaerens TaxID=106592 RepID=UPI001CBBB3EF|nr:hypothetical protein [Ensifer adhaerens]MBZ7924395.1 hypothetical protein [Ensifer adhaerens]UAX96359.1 hypothetical protein LAC78_21405 [Ensifer adhaerens]UAY04298.1 hypothetical protein LAC80_23555 [Ensifer adhaerens]UAY12284.1 hypothetical protein LAC81_27080 [Ensifer adhaerens]